MLQAANSPRREKPEPAWDIARLYPNQGVWDEGDYLAIETNHLVEFSDGYVEVLSMPTMSHQMIVQFLSNALFAFVTANGAGTMLFAPLRVRLRKNKYREPDVVFMLAEHADRMGEKFWEKADLLMEVVSDDPEDRERDLVVKRAEYAKAGIPECWTVDPQERRITVLALKRKTYIVKGEYRLTGTAASAFLKGFEVDVAAVWAAGRLGRK